MEPGDVVVGDARRGGGSHRSAQVTGAPWPSRTASGRANLGVGRVDHRGPRVHGGCGDEWRTAYSPPSLACSAQRRGSQRPERVAPRLRSGCDGVARIARVRHAFGGVSPSTIDRPRTYHSEDVPAALRNGDDVDAISSVGFRHVRLAVTAHRRTVPVRSRASSRSRLALVAGCSSSSPLADVRRPWATTARGRSSPASLPAIARPDGPHCAAAGGPGRDASLDAAASRVVRDTASPRSSSPRTAGSASRASRAASSSATNRGARRQRASASLSHRSTRPRSWNSPMAAPGPDQLDCSVPDGQMATGFRSSSTFANLVADPAVSGLVVTIHDVTRWKALEDAADPARVPRPADRPAEPGPVHRPPRARARPAPPARPGHRGPVRRPRRLQDRQRLARPRRGRRCSSPRSPSACSRRSGRRTRPPASAATSSRCSSTTSTRTRRAAVATRVLAALDRPFAPDRALDPDRRQRSASPTARPA